jgi:prevent-host-death family protein
MMMVNVHDAKSQLSKLLDAARRGDEVIVTRRGERFRIIAEPTIDRAAAFGMLTGSLPSDAEWAESDAAVLVDFEQSLSKDPLW